MSFICSGLVSFVPSCASPLLNARRVGIELIYRKNQPVQYNLFLKRLQKFDVITIYFTPKSEISTESSSTSEYPIPPSVSPTPSSSISSLRIGLITAHVKHHEADQRVISGRLLLAERSRSVESSSGVRILVFSGKLKPHSRSDRARITNCRCGSY